MRFEKIKEDSETRHQEIWYHEGKYYLYSYVNHLSGDDDVPGFEETMVFESNLVGDIGWKEPLWEDSGRGDPEKTMAEVMRLVANE